MARDLYFVRGLTLNGEHKEMSVYADSAEEAKDVFLKDNTNYDYIGIRNLDLDPASYVIERGIDASGIKFQVENWNDKYPNSCNKNSTIGFYPICKNYVGSYPQLGKTFRAALEFPNEKEAWTAFTNLVLGKKSFLDYIENFQTNTMPAETFLAAVRQ